MIQVIAIITAHPGKRAELLEKVAGNLAAVRQEAGCIEYQPVIDAAERASAWAAFGPDVVVIVEKWESRAALEAHAVAPHMQAYAAKVKDLVAARAIHVLEAA